MKRRDFISGCAACTGCLASGCILTPKASVDGSGKKPRIRVVFSETTSDHPIWPNIGYDFEKRDNQVLKTLKSGCPDLEFLPMHVVDVDKNRSARQVLDANGEVDGYIICLQGLGWKNRICEMCGTGKPTLVVDNLFGGSGKLLTRINQFMNMGKPVDWVSSSDDNDIIASARHFTMLNKGASPEKIAKAFRETRHRNTPTDRDMSCIEDKLPAVNMDKVLKDLKKTKILVVSRGSKPASVDEVTGITLQRISFEEMADAYDSTRLKEGDSFAEHWINNAQEIVDVPPDEIQRSGRMYIAMKKLMDKHGANGITINCLGGFYGGHLKAYPCLGFSQFNNDGLIGGCEADTHSAMTMAIYGAMVGRPGYISDPVIDTSKNQIIYAHCVAETKPFGPNGPANPYRIMTHSEDRKGAALQSLLPEGYMVTSAKLDSRNRRMVMHQGRTAGNNYSDMACRTKLETTVKGDIEKLTEGWTFGWHRVTCYGDLKEELAEFCNRLKIELVEEA